MIAIYSKLQDRKRNKNEDCYYYDSTRLKKCTWIRFTVLFTSSYKNNGKLLVSFTCPRILVTLTVKKTWIWNWQQGPGTWLQGHGVCLWELFISQGKDFRIRYNKRPGPCLRNLIQIRLISLLQANPKFSLPLSTKTKHVHLDMEYIPQVQHSSNQFSSFVSFHLLSIVHGRNL